MNKDQILSLIKCCKIQRNNFIRSRKEQFLFDKRFVFIQLIIHILNVRIIFIQGIINIPSSNKRPRHLFNFEALRRGAHLRTALKRGKRLF